MFIRSPAKNNLALYEILTSEFIQILSDKAPYRGNPEPGPLDPGIYFDHYPSSC